MELFDKRFVHFMWDDSLKGNVGFFADSIDILKWNVENNDGVKKTASDIYTVHLSFLDDDKTAWKFFYCDPLYEYRWAFKQGKKVQVRLPFSGWTDVTQNHTWDYGLEYRIVEEKKPERLTYKQLAMWLAKGNGQAINDERELTHSGICYPTQEDDLILPEGWQVRRWDDEWREPTREYCFPEEKGD